MTTVNIFLRYFDFSRVNMDKDVSGTSDIFREIDEL